MVKDLAETTVKILRPPKPGEDPTIWQWGIAGFMAAILAVLVVHLMLAKGINVGFAGLHVAPVARADEVDAKIAAAVNPLKEQMGDIDKRTIAILRLQYDPLIRAKVHQRCMTTERRDREDINQQIDRILADYLDATGERYGPLPTCDEV